MTAAAFKATYSDWKLVKTRGVVQIVFEVPLAEADLAYKVVGGMPNIAAESWFGIAKLRDTNAAVSSPPSAAGEADAGTTAWTAAASPSKQRKPVAPEKRLAQQAGICCADPVFQRYMVQLGMVRTAREDEVAQAVRNLCAVESRSQLIPNTPEGNLWEKIYGQFLGWRDHDMPAGEAA